MAFAYADKYGTLHIVGEERIAKEHVGEGRHIVPTAFPHDNGYPIAFNEDTGKEESLFVYVDSNTCLIGGNSKEKGGKDYPISNILQGLIDAVK